MQLLKGRRAAAGGTPSKVGRRPRLPLSPPPATATHAASCACRRQLHLSVAAAAASWLRSCCRRRCLRGLCARLTASPRARVPASQHTCATLPGPPCRAGQAGCQGAGGAAAAGRGAAGAAGSGARRRGRRPGHAARCAAAAATPACRCAAHAAAPLSRDGLGSSSALASDSAPLHALHALFAWRGPLLCPYNCGPHPRTPPPQCRC